MLLEVNNIQWPNNGRKKSDRRRIFEWCYWSIVLYQHISCRGQPASKKSHHQVSIHGQKSAHSYTGKTVLMLFNRNVFLIIKGDYHPRIVIFFYLRINYCFKLSYYFNVDSCFNYFIFSTNKWLAEPAVQVQTLMENLSSWLNPTR